MVLAYVITLIGNEYSERVADHCIATGERFGVKVEPFPATSAEDAEHVMESFGLRWTFPLEGEAVCPSTGLLLRAYRNRDLRARIGCAMSHYRLWRECGAQEEPCLILEHDAEFIRAIPDHAWDFKTACMVNSPKGATPHGLKWWQKMIDQGPGLHPKTHIFPDDIPDGLAGNSAYLLRPATAIDLMNLYALHGVWPNDATMCRQLVPNLEECYPFVTCVRSTQSTTAG